MKLHNLDIGDALASLHSQRGGLSAAEAERRLGEFGQNRIERLARAPLWRRFLGEFSHLFALILWVAAGLAFLSEWRDPGKGMALLGWAIVGVILINGLFSFLQEFRAERVLASLEALLPQEVSVLRQGVRQLLPSTAVVPGDIVLLREGDAIPADCLLVGQALAPDATLYRQATTATLAAIIVMQAVNVFLCRDPRRSSLARGPAANPVILMGVAVELGLIGFIAYAPWGNRLFGSAPLDWQVWVFLLPFAIAMLVLEEARKALLRRWRPQRRRQAAG